MAIERKYERDVDILLAEEFEVSPSFATWFLGGIPRFAEVDARVLEVSVSKSDYLGESDLIVVFEKSGADSRFALFVEDKIDAPFQPEQEARYRMRAENGVLRGYYAEYQVVLCSPESYPTTHPDAGLFDAFVSYESMAAFLRSHGPDDRRGVYRADFLATAAKRSASGWKIDPDPVTDAFWCAGYEMASRDFPDLEMKPPAFTRGSTWIDLRPMDMPTQPRVSVSLKGSLGFIDLTFARVLSRLFSPAISSLLDPDMTVHQTGKSAAIRLVVGSFKVSAVDEAALSKLRSAFVACVRLIRFYRVHRQALDSAASEARPESAPVLLLPRKLSNEPAIGGDLVCKHTSITPDDASERPQTVLEVGAEGGSITLFRVKRAGGEFQFGVTTNESLLDDEDLGHDDVPHARSTYVVSFLAALELLDKYPWISLHPLSVHPDYLNEVLREVQKRGGSMAEFRWREEIAQPSS